MFEVQVERLRLLRGSAHQGNQGAALRLGVRRVAAHAHIGESGGDRRADLLRQVRRSEGERRAAGTAEGLDFPGLPTLVAELEGVTAVFGERLQEPAEHFVVSPEPGRALEQDRAQPLPERCQGVPEGRRRFRRGVPQPRPMGDPLVRLDREAETGRHALRPRGGEGRGREPAKGVVDLDAAEDRRVMGEEVLGLRLLRIEGSHPLAEPVTGGPGEERQLSSNRFSKAAFASFAVSSFRPVRSRTSVGRKWKHSFPAHLSVMRSGMSARHSNRSPGSKSAQ